MSGHKIILPPMCSWAMEQRLLWIADLCRIYGYINREHVMRKFRITEASVSGDFRTLVNLNPGLMHYDKSRKAYVWDLTSHEREH